MRWHSIALGLDIMQKIFAMLLLLQLLFLCVFAVVDFFSVCFFSSVVCLHILCLFGPLFIVWSFVYFIFFVACPNDGQTNVIPFILYTHTHTYMRLFFRTVARLPYIADDMYHSALLFQPHTQAHTYNIRVDCYISV